MERLGETQAVWMKGGRKWKSLSVQLLILRPTFRSLLLYVAQLDTT